jgi:REP element-mobilizing transposase RayT
VRGYDPRRHHRRSIRLRGYDYAQAGAYFVTICTQDRECLLGWIVDGKMRLSEAGRMVQSVWDELPARYPGVDVDEFVVMPNHIHGIIVLTGVGATTGGCPDGVVDAVDGQARGPAPTDGGPAPTDGGSAPTDGDGAGLSLPDVVHRFKSFTTARYRHGVNNMGWMPFPGRLWQRNYYEHIIRNDDELGRIRRYIALLAAPVAPGRGSEQRPGGSGQTLVVPVPGTIRIPGSVCRPETGLGAEGVGSLPSLKRSWSQSRGGSAQPQVALHRDLTIRPNHGILVMFY